MSTAHEDLIKRFYAAFAAHDGYTMASCYAPNATFSDPVFTDLKGEEPGAMWRMLTGRADDLTVELVEHEAGRSAAARAGSRTTHSRRPGARSSTTCARSSASPAG